MKNLITSMILAILMLMGYDPQALVKTNEPVAEQIDCSAALSAANAKATSKTLDSSENENENEMTVEDAFAR